MCAQKGVEMLNSLILIGRLTDKPKLVTYDNGMKVCNITLAVLKPFRSLESGEFETEFIPVTLWYGTANYTALYCDKGDTVAIKGRVVTKVIKHEGVNIHTLEVVGDRVIFINLKSHKEGSIEDNNAETKND